MDAMSHAIESYLSLDWGAYGDAHALHALRLMHANLERAVTNGPVDDDARGNMLVATSMAIANQLGSTHAMSHPTGAQFGVPHGVANAIFLPHVICFNAAGGEHIVNRYRDVGNLLDVEPVGSPNEVAEALATHLTELTRRLELPTQLSQVGVSEEAVPALVEGAMGDAFSLLNPREPSEED